MCNIGYRPTSKQYCFAVLPRVAIRLILMSKKYNNCRKVNTDETFPGKDGINLVTLVQFVCRSGTGMLRDYATENLLYFANMFQN